MRRQTAVWLLLAGVLAAGGVLLALTAADAESTETQCGLTFTSDYGLPFQYQETGEWIGQSQQVAVESARAALPELQEQRRRAGDTESFEMLPAVYEALARLYERPRPTILDEHEFEYGPGVATWAELEDGKVQGILVLRDLTARYKEDLPSSWVVEERNLLVPKGTCDAPGAEGPDEGSGFSLKSASCATGSGMAPALLSLGSGPCPQR